jgi:hypothetical protein
MEDEGRLAQLKRKVMLLDETVMTEQLRANESVSFGARERGQGLEQRYHNFDQHLEQVKVGTTWAPWLPGHKGHDHLMELAHASAGRAGGGRDRAGLSGGGAVDSAPP